MYKVSSDIGYYSNLLGMHLQCVLSIRLMNVNTYSIIPDIKRATPTGSRRTSQPINLHDWYECSSVILECMVKIVLMIVNRESQNLTLNIFDQIKCSQHAVDWYVNIIVHNVKCDYKVQEQPTAPLCGRAVRDAVQLMTWVGVITFHRKTIHSLMRNGRQGLTVYRSSSRSILQY